MAFGWTPTEKLMVLMENNMSKHPPLASGTTDERCDTSNSPEIGKLLDPFQGGTYRSRYGGARLNLGTVQDYE